MKKEKLTNKPKPSKNLKVFILMDLCSGDFRIANSLDLPDVLRDFRELGQVIDICEISKITRLEETVTSKVISFKQFLGEV